MSGVMEMASDLMAKTGDIAYVRFYTESKHLPKRSEEEGRYVAIDVDMVEVIQKGARDGVKFEVSRWLRQNLAEVAGQRLPREHEQRYKQMYDLWKNGQEMPLEGTPIKGWAVIPPSQQEAIIHAGIRTVDDLAKMNGEAMQRIGMGAVMLKNKAQAWMAQAQDKGPLTLEMAKLKADNDLLKLNMQKLQEQLQALQNEKPKRQVRVQRQEEQEEGIGLSEIMDEEPQKRGPGRPRKDAV